MGWHDISKAHMSLSNQGKSIVHDNPIYTLVSNNISNVQFDTLHLTP